MSRFFFLVFSFFCISNISLGNVDKPKNLLIKAQTSFDLAMSKKGLEKKHELLKSIYLFRSLIEKHHIKNGYLYYNIGNTYLALEDLGNAILFYRKAEKLIPTSSNLNDNLKTARSRLKIQWKENQSDKYLKKIFFWHFSLSYSIKIFILSSCFIIFWIVLAWKMYQPKTWLLWIRNLAIFGFLLFCGSLAFSGYQIYQPKSAVIIGTKITVYKGPGVSYGKAFEQNLEGGLEVNILYQKKNWIQVQLGDQSTCWIQNRYLHKI
ncbi:MAG: tetratricopeptide (TPR) repeat protein [bacterium]|jgi:tetratricopeptide (TPR) repeat protein